MVVRRTKLMPLLQPLAFCWKSIHIIANNHPIAFLKIISPKHFELDLGRSGQQMQQLVLQDTKDLGGSKVLLYLINSTLYYQFRDDRVSS
jgi:hypothetical protein